ncbi:hypothetical protein PINS_up015315 [Pythium insidiosum]|nr:hypothetical protein PINS_up015315 [Pythium insidiosum]
MRLKQEQLRKVAELNNTLNDNYGGGGGHYGPGQGGSSSHAQDSKSSEMQVPRDLVGYIIGRGGETIRELQMKSGAQIQIGARRLWRTPAAASSLLASRATTKRSSVLGHLIQKLIDERVNGGRDSRDDRGGRFGGSNPDWQRDAEILVQNDRVGLIIGRAGATIKRFSSERARASTFRKPPTPTTQTCVFRDCQWHPRSKELARTRSCRSSTKEPNKPSWSS